MTTSNPNALWTPEPDPLMTYRWREPMGDNRSVEADRITFGPAHVIFHAGDRVVLAVHNEDVCYLSQDVTSE